jgi:arsenate reductase
LAVAEQLNVEAKVIQYLKEKPTRDELEKLIGMLVDPVEDLVRKDSKFKALNLNPDDYVAKPEAVLDLLSSHIELLQRPILVKGGKAIIGRPKDRMPDFMSS